MTNNYEVVLKNKYYLRELIESITLEDSIDEIAYRATVQLKVTDDLAAIGIAPGDAIRVSGIPYGGNSMVYLLHPGIVWECDSTLSSGTKHIEVTIYDRTIYLDKSEDEYLFASGTTASQRIKQYCNDWGIPISNIPDTGVQLAKAVYRSQSIYSMIQSDIKETAQKGGKLYKPRMTPNGFELYELGTNTNPYYFELVENIRQNRTLEGAITQVKVLGNAEEDQRSPVLAVVKGETDKYGTLQKVLQDEKITNASQANAAGQKLLTGMQEKFSVTGPDVNTIRAGDKVILNNMELIVVSVQHELGNPGHMNLDLASMDYVRRNYYAESV
jgi:hypothetical protein